MLRAYAVISLGRQQQQGVYLESAFVLPKQVMFDKLMKYFNIYMNDTFKWNIYIFFRPVRHAVFVLPTQDSVVWPLAPGDFVIFLGWCSPWV